jgi:hypothetical protein
MTISIILLLASLLTIGFFRMSRDSRAEDLAEQVNESPVKAEEISEPQSEIVIENPPHQAEEKKAVQKKPVPVKKTPIKKAPAKSAPAKKTTTKK